MLPVSWCRADGTLSNSDDSLAQPVILAQKEKLNYSLTDSLVERSLWTTKDLANDAFGIRTPKDSTYYIKNGELFLISNGKAPED